MRLIDADKIEIDEECTFSGKGIKAFLDAIPTAYDVDKVVERINDIGKRYCDSVKCDKNCDDCEHGYLMYAITNVIKSSDND